MERAQSVADIAAKHAEEVDQNAVFPEAAIAAAKRNGLFALLVPTEYGGEGAPLSSVADVCYTLGQACASTAMIVAMHQAALACVVRHHQGNRWHTRLLRRVAAENLLLASSTTEGNAGGNVRSSAAALIYEGDRISLDRAATVMSYGAQADGIVSTARRDIEGAASDQALVVFLKEDYRLEPTGEWQTLGMRGTCSAGFGLKASGLAAQVLPVGYDKIHPQSMVPVSHLTWAGVWTGIAAAAVGRSQMFIRTAARRSGGQMPPGAARHTRAVASLRSLRGMVAAALASYERMQDDPLALGALDTQTALNLLKVEASEQAVEIVSTAMRACGLSGYRIDGDFAIGRHLRDILSAPIMVHNDRILSNIASTALMTGVPTSLRD
jgi:acyl-CoA dehydrogenase